MPAFTPEVQAELIERIIAGEGIKAICRDAHMPAERTVYVKMAEDEAFASAISRAREAQQDSIADECVEMADLATVEDREVVKLRIWARQWRASKLAPKKYGDKVTTTVEGGEKPIQIEDASPLETARRIAFVLAQGARQQEPSDGK